MSRIRTLDNLVERVDEELVWRRKDLDYLKGFIDRDRNAGAPQASWIRACIVMLYAHWEGFVKAASLAYLEFVFNQSGKFSDFQPCFSLHAAKSQIQQAMASSRYKYKIEFIDTLSNIKASGIERSYFSEGIINTRSNLGMEVLEDILLSLGINPAYYKNHSAEIGKLLDSRNNIAHGKFLSLDKDGFSKLYNDIWSLLNAFKADISNAAYTQAYKRVNDSPSM